MPDITLESPSAARRAGPAPVALEELGASLAGLPLDPEPAWRASRRHEAWKRFLELPYPHRKDEHWRFATVQRSLVEGFCPGAGLDEHLGAAIRERSNLIGDTAGKILFGDSALVDAKELPSSLLERGVVFKPIAEAASTHGNLLEEACARVGEDLGSAKYEALHTALSREGVLLYIPRGVTIDEPFVVYHWLCGANAAVFPHTVVIAEDQSQVNFVECFFSHAADNPGLAVSRTQVFAGQGAHVFRKVIQDWNEDTLSFQHDSTFARRDAHVRNVAINLGARRARYENQVRIEGPGADVKLYSLTVAENQQEFDQRTLQVHGAPNATSDLLYKNALLDESRTIFSGLIKVEPEAQQTDAYQTNRNLLLDPSAEANSLPGLEIEANDVKCSHGATTSKLDAGELFYLRSRGLPERAAKQLLVFGFFEEIINQIENEDLADNVRAMVHAKFHQHSRI